MSDPNIANITDLDALNLVDFLIVAHYEDKYKQDVLNGAKTTKYPVVAITDCQAIMVKDGTNSIIGPGEVLAFNGFKINE